MLQLQSAQIRVFTSLEAVFFSFAIKHTLGTPSGAELKRYVEASQRVSPFMASLVRG